MHCLSLLENFASTAICIFLATWLALIPATSSDQISYCSLERDITTCSSQDNYGRELFCVAKQNTLTSLMNCVTTPFTNHSDRAFCRSPDLNTADGSDASIDASEYPNSKGVCWTARNVIYGRSIKDCRTCGLAGAIKQCPVHDPKFKHCVCQYFKAAETSLDCLSKCFKEEDSAASFCGYSTSSVSRRDKEDRYSENEFVLDKSSMFKLEVSFLTKFHDLIVCLY